MTYLEERDKLESILEENPFLEKRILITALQKLLMLWYKKNGKDIPKIFKDKNISYTDNTLLKLCKDKAFWDDDFFWIRSSIAQNRNVSPSVLRIIFYSAKDYEKGEDIFIVLNIAGNKKTPKPILRRLSKSKNAELRELVASNPSTPKDIIKKLTNDPVMTVQRSAKEGFEKSINKYTEGYIEKNILQIKK